MPSLAGRSVPVGAAPRRDRVVWWSSGSLRCARSRRGGAPTVILAAALNDGLKFGVAGEPPAVAQIGGPGCVRWDSGGMGWGHPNRVGFRNIGRDDGLRGSPLTPTPLPSGGGALETPASRREGWGRSELAQKLRLKMCRLRNSGPSTSWSWCCSCRRRSAASSRPRCPSTPPGSPTRHRRGRHLRSSTPPQTGRRPGSRR